MRYIVVAVRDRAADAYGVPVFVASLGQGIRSFSDEVNRDAEGNAMAAHPDDFDLYSLGTYDDATGNFECSIPKQVCVGKDVRIKKNGS